MLGLVEVGRLFSQQLRGGERDVFAGCCWFALKPKAETLNPKPQTLNPEPKEFRSSQRP